MLEHTIRQVHKNSLYKFVRLSNLMRFLKMSNDSDDRSVEFGPNDRA